jgi:hypothetical protein
MTHTARHAALAAALVFALLLPGCGGDDDTGTLPDVRNSIVLITVTPNPVVATQNSLTLLATAACKITLTELNGLGGEVLFISSSVQDPASGGQLTVSYYDSAALKVFVGKSRLDPLDTLELPQTLNYTVPDFTKAANLVVSIQVKDDRSNLINQTLLVKIE